MANRFNQWRNAKKYHAKLNLLSKIRREISPVLEAKELAENSSWSLLDNSPESYGSDVSKYSDVPVALSLESCLSLLKRSKEDFQFQVQARKGTVLLGKNWK